MALTFCDGGGLCRQRRCGRRAHQVLAYGPALLTLPMTPAPHSHPRARPAVKPGLARVGWVLGGAERGRARSGRGVPPLPSPAPGQ